MAEIVIRIQVPDGVNVRVDQGNDKPFVQRPAPAQPTDGGCPVHEVAWKLVPAGTSRKTGKPYNAFWACPERGCDEKPSYDDNSDLPF